MDGKAISGVFIQAILFMLVGFILATHNLPSSPEEASLQIIGQVVDTTEKNIDQSEVLSVLQNLKQTLLILGVLMSISGIVEFIGLVFWTGSRLYPRRI